MLIKFVKIVKKLSSKSGRLREEGLQELRRLDIQEITFDHLAYLVEAAGTVHQDPEQQDQDGSYEILNFLSQYNEPAIAPHLASVFPRMSGWAQTVALELLLKMNTAQTIEQFLALLDAWPRERPPVSFLIPLDGSENESAALLLPRLAIYAQEPRWAYPIYYYALDCLEKGSIQASEVPALAAPLIKQYRLLAKVIEPLQPTLTAERLWQPSYQQARHRAGLMLELMGYFPGPDTEELAKRALAYRDRRLQVFAALTLLRLDQPVPAHVWKELGADKETRNVLYDGLAAQNALALFPKKYETQAYFAEAEMAAWLTFPEALGHVPDALEWMGTVTRHDEYAGAQHYYLFRFQTNRGPRSGQGWMAGVAGPYTEALMPTTHSEGYTYSLFAPWEGRSAQEHLNAVFEAVEQAWEDTEA